MSEDGQLIYRHGHELSDGALHFLTHHMVGEGLWCLEQSPAPVSQRSAQVLWREYDRLIANAEQATAIQKHRADHEEKYLRVETTKWVSLRN